jgi:hypothetical protein
MISELVVLDTKNFPNAWRWFASGLAWVIGWMTGILGPNRYVELTHLGFSRFSRSVDALDLGRIVKLPQISIMAHFQEKTIMGVT